MDIIKQFTEFAQPFTFDVKYNEPMKSHTTFNTGGNADVFVSPKSMKELEAILAFCKEKSIKPFIVGRGSNLLVKDIGIRGVVIHLGNDFDDISLIDDTTIVCLAGTSLMKVCKFALDNSLSGLEFAYGIPGSVGGGVYMNAGAYGGEMKDVLFKCDHIGLDGEHGSFEGNDLMLSYRHSVYKDSDKIICKAYLKLKKGDQDEIRAKMDDFMGRRKDKQPLDYPSAGSTFKRPEGYYAGKLIEECGLKGANVGDAQVSEKHCGFIINKGNATTADILKLIGIVQDFVLAKTGVFLETEVKIV
ncbi:MAG: UDP-N-acetylmuramate dehydrogenase [Clostridia bacterium]|nr:UDP-N-acetylmuramate dehydrogenase [Clostridia bacterium]